MLCCKRMYSVNLLIYLKDCVLDLFGHEAFPLSVAIGHGHRPLATWRVSKPRDLERWRNNIMHLQTGRLEMLNGADATCCQTAQMLSACELHGGCIWIKKRDIFLSGRICLPGQPLDTFRKDLFSWTATGQVLDFWTVTGQVLDSRTAVAQV